MTQANKLRSPVKYFGGKGGALKKEILVRFPDKSEYDTYIEPFGGGASILFGKEPFGSEIYNDLEQNVYCFFKVLQDKVMFQEFKSLCDLSLYSKQLKQEYTGDLKKNDLSMVERAYKFFYVNRTSVNGIGGFAVTVNYIRRNMSKSTSDFLSAIDRLPEVHQRLSSVIIENMDGIKLIEKYDRKRVLIYADPPYHQDTRTTARYKVDMNNETQIKLIDVMLEMKNAMILLSAYNCPEYDRLKKAGWNKMEIEVKTIDGNRKPKMKTEILWSNFSKNAKKSDKDENKQECHFNLDEA